MKHLLTTLVFLGLVNLSLFNFPNIAHATTTWVQGPTVVSTAGVTTLSKVFAGSTPAGNLIVACITQQQGPGLKAITRVYDSVDGIGATYSLGGSQVSAGARVDMYYKVAAGTGTRTVTVDFTGGTTDSSMGINEFDSTYTVKDAANTNTGSSNPSTSGSVTPSAAALYVVCEVNDNGATHTGPAAPFTTRQIVDSSAISSFLFAEQTTSGALNASISYGSAPGTWDVVITTFVSGVGVPILTTDAVNRNSPFSATFNGTVTDIKGSSVTTRGFAWGTNPSLSGGDTATTTESGTFGTGAFSSMQTLNCNTTYYARAYATNTTGTAVASIVSFTTAICGIPPRAAINNGRVIINNGSIVIR